MNGVFWIETDTGKITLAVSFPRWEDVFSPYALRYSMQDDHKDGVTDDDYQSYLYFREQAIPLAIFELQRYYKEFRASRLIDGRALMNVLYRDFPDYVMAYNVVEQRGLHDAHGLFLNAVGIETELSANPDNMVSQCPEAGFEYLRF